MLAVTAARSAGGGPSHVSHGGLRVRVAVPEPWQSESDVDGCDRDSAVGRLSVRVRQWRIPPHTSYFDDGDRDRHLGASDSDRDS